MNDLLHFEDFPVGKTFEFGSFTLAEAQLKAYGEAFDPRPAHDGPGALPSGVRPSASPWQLCALLMRLNYDGWMFQTAARGAPGVDEVRWLRAVHPGDVVTGRYTVLNARVSQSKPGLGLVQYHYELLGRDRAPVLSQTNYVMVARRHLGAVTRATAMTELRPSSKNATALPTENGKPGRTIDLGTAEFTAESILAFARIYDPQPFHVDETAAKTGPFGALTASGWHTAASWMRAYMQTLRRGGAALPTPEKFLSATNLRWLRPVYAGDRIAFDFTPLDVAQSAAGEMVVTSRNSGVNQDAIKVYEFTATMMIAERDWQCDRGMSSQSKAALQAAR